MIDNEATLPDLPSEQPQQSSDVPKWEFKPRKNPKWGEVTKVGLVVGRGPNQKVIHPDEVYRLARLGCNLEEISDFFMIDRETLKYNFWDYIQKGKAETKHRLRDAQIKLALQGNAAMLIWLGKNLLGQSDNPLNRDDNQPLPWSDQ